MRPRHANCIEMSEILYECYDTKDGNIENMENLTQQQHFVSLLIKFYEEKMYT